jgi:hypothetical protein
MIKGLINPAKTLLAACKPRVPLKRSTVKPIENDNTNKSQPGVSKGRSRINNI